MALIGVLFWAAVCPILNPPQVVKVPQPYPVYQTVNHTEYIDRWHEPEVIVKEVETIVTVNQTEYVEKARWIVAQPFEDKDEMLAFLDYWRENKAIIITCGADGTADFTQVENNCVDMATQLKQMAAEQGKDFDTEVLSICEMHDIYGKWFDRPHMINKARLFNGECWYYDFNTDRLWQQW